eukprot:scaffold1307_cov200-Pinguiococcus_pyrenoidosus.AAC.87
MGLANGSRGHFFPAAELPGAALSRAHLPVRLLDASRLEYALRGRASAHRKQAALRGQGSAGGLPRVYISGAAAGVFWRDRRLPAAHGP